jgi:hypothetical protein
MSGVLSYRLRAEGPHLSKGLGKFSLLSFFQNVFATHEPKVLQILFLFDCLFLCLLFFKTWREKVLIPMNQRFYRFYFYFIVYFYVFFFLRSGEKRF